MDPQGDQNQQQQGAAAPVGNTPAEAAPVEPAAAPAPEPAATEPAQQTEQPAAVVQPDSSEAMPAPAAPEPAAAPEAQAETATPAAVETAPTKAPVANFEYPVVNEEDWDKKQVQLNKKFFQGMTAFSPRVFYVPISMPIDTLRAIQAAEKAGYKAVANPMLLDTGHRFMSKLMIEVTGTDSNAPDKNLLSLEGKSFYSKIATLPWPKLKQEKDAIAKEMGKSISEFYILHAKSSKTNELIRIYLAA